MLLKQLCEHHGLGDDVKTIEVRPGKDIFDEGALVTDEADSIATEGIVALEGLELTGVDNKDSASVVSHEVKYIPEKNLSCNYTVTKHEDGSCTYRFNLRGGIYYFHNYSNLIDVLNFATTNDVVILNITGPGGSVDIASRICSALKSTRAKTIGVASGLVASADSFIWSNCAYQVKAPRAVYMYHMAIFGMYGAATDIKNHAEEVIYEVKTKLLHDARAKGHITEEEFKNIIENNEQVFIDSDTMNQRLSDSANALDYEHINRIKSTPELETITDDELNDDGTDEDNSNKDHKGGE